MRLENSHRIFSICQTILLSTSHTQRTVHAQNAEALLHGHVGIQEEGTHIAQTAHRQREYFN